MSGADSKSSWGGWGTQSQPDNQPRLLEDVMSEELAEQLQQEEEDNLRHIEESFVPAVTEPVQTLDGAGTSSELTEVEEILAQSDETSNDLLVAQMLQMQFDKEADLHLQSEQDHYNKNSKICISYEKYRNVHPSLQDDVYHEDDEEIYEQRAERVDLQFSKKSGTRGSGKNIVTKHDADITGKNNATRAMDKFSLHMQTGDADKYNMKLPNKVYNKLRVHSLQENKRAARLHEKKDQSTATQAVDQKTRLQLFKMLNSGLLEEVHGVISMGKESAVIHATGGKLENNRHELVQLPHECALKVYKTTLSEFKNREKYVRGDFRLANEFSKQNPRKIMKMWAEKEMLNLKRLRKFGIPCPEVVKLRKHILVMQFIGRDQVPAPKLKDAKLNRDDLHSAYHQVLSGIKNMYKLCTLVHADLSEYNLLWDEGRVVFIDVSQSVDLSHPLCHEFLLRDCQNVSSFFTRHGLPDVINPYTLFNEVTGMNLTITESAAEFLQQIQEYEKEQAAYDLDSQRKEFAFDVMFARSTAAEQEVDSSEGSDSDDDEISENIRDKLSLSTELTPNKIKSNNPMSLPTEQTSDNSQLPTEQREGNSQLPTEQREDNSEKTMTFIGN